MADHWWELGTCVTPAFKAKTLEAGAFKSPGQVFYPITETDDGRVSKTHVNIPKYRNRQLRFDQLKREACGACPVRRDCLLDACQNDGETPIGFSGGLDPKQRLDLVNGAELISSQCLGCDTALWGTTNIAPPKRCSSLCKATT